ncbi:MAG: class I SAM-dependent methyltransferase [Pseudobdellovibrio sp.]
MKISEVFINTDSPETLQKAQAWSEFLKKEKFDLNSISRIDMSESCPAVYDQQGNKFKIDFVNNKTNYHKKKSSIKNEIISKAMGAGKQGLNLLDLSAGLGIDAVFLSQLGFKVTAVERNPLIYLCLKNAAEQVPDLKIKFVYSDSLSYLSEKNDYDVVYFDPMFPEKSKSALPRQEMVFFKGLVGTDEDAAQVLQRALSLKKFKRVVVKRPLKAPELLMKPTGSVDGKLIRFDIYGVQK